MHVLLNVDLMDPIVYSIKKNCLKNFLKYKLNVSAYHWTSQRKRFSYNWLKRGII